MGRTGIPPLKSDRRVGLWVALPAGLLALVTTWTTVGYGFVQDDFFLIPDNPQIRSLASLPEIFASPYSRYAGLAGMTYDYRPLPIATFCLEYQIAGDAPWVYHLDNVLLHAATAVLAALLALRLTGHPVAAAFAGILFAVMPVHCDNVASVTERSGLLVLFFGLAFLRWHGSPGFRRRAAAAAALLLALLSKESAVVFPVLALLQDYREAGLPRPLLRAAVARYAPAALALVAYFAWRAAVIGGVAYDPTWAYFTPEVSAARVFPTMGRFLLQGYLAPAICAYHRSSDYSWRSFPTSAAGDLVGWAVLAVVGAAGVWLTVRFVRTRSAWSLGLLWFLGTLFPVSNLAVRIMIVGAERLLYLPSYGLALAGGVLAAWAVSPAQSRLRRALAWTIVSLYLAGSVLGLAEGCAGWRNERAFYDQVLTACPDNVLALAGRALLADEPGEFPQGLADGERAIRVAPEAPEMRYALGWTLLRAGFPDAAGFVARQGLALDVHTRHKGLTLLADTRLALGDPEGAASAYPCDQRPLDPDPWRDRAAALLARGELAAAYEAVGKARALGPDEPWSAALEVRILARCGRTEDAGLALMRPPLADPDSPPGAAARAAIQFEGKQPALAARLLRDALGRDPDAPLLHAWLADALEATGDAQGAEAERLRARPGGRSLWRNAQWPPEERERRHRGELQRVLDLTLGVGALEPIAEEIRAALR